ncbi:MAG: hypothetical protein D6813_00205 [Calditrichaeota bacterium]|nr:MAG: hypothetical protein D6813_00205 [Calditrichota bacterium]
MKNKRLGVCLKEHEVEKFILQNKGKKCYKEVDFCNHIQTCQRCYSYYINLKLFHEILSIELKKPINPKTFELVDILTNNG